jgi:DNA-binding transcriptional regulator GbsR (MarR family)
MELDKAREQFILSWGALGTSWGINKTMCQIHALLLVSPVAMSTEEVMDSLKISRGNASMNLRSLMEWGLVTKKGVTGDRKEYYYADKDVWEMARKITAQRRKRELEPVLLLLNNLNKQEITGHHELEVKQFKKTIKDLNKFSSKMNAIADKFISSDENWFLKTIVNMIK